MTFKEACDIVYPAVTKYYYDKSDITVDTKLVCDKGGDISYTFWVGIGDEMRVVSEKETLFGFVELAEWIESKRKC